MATHARSSQGGITLTLMGIMEPQQTYFAKPRRKTQRSNNNSHAVSELNRNNNITKDKARLCFVEVTSSTKGPVGRFRSKKPLSETTPQDLFQKKYFSAEVILDAKPSDPDYEAQQEFLEQAASNFNCVALLSDAYRKVMPTLSKPANHKGGWSLVLAAYNHIKDHKDDLFNQVQLDIWDKSEKRCLSYVHNNVNELMAEFCEGESSGLMQHRLAGTDYFQGSRIKLDGKTLHLPKTSKGSFARLKTLKGKIPSGYTSHTAIITRDRYSRGYKYFINIVFSIPIDFRKFPAETLTMQELAPKGEARRNTPVGERRQLSESAKKCGLERKQDAKRNHLSVWRLLRTYDPHKADGDTNTGYETKVVIFRQNRFQDYKQTGQQILTGYSNLQSDEHVTYRNYLAQRSVIDRAEGQANILRAKYPSYALEYPPPLNPYLAL